MPAPIVDLTCDECGASFTRLKRDVARRLRNGQTRHFCSLSCSGKARHSDPTPTNTFLIEDEPYKNGHVPTRPQRFNTAWNIEGDALVLSDLHIPATDWQFANLALQVAQAHLPEPRTCVIVGDLVNMDAVSKWDKLIMETPLRDELEYARGYLAHLATHFERIYIVRGNHEDRLFKKLNGELDSNDFLKMLTDHDKIKFSMYAHCTVTSGGETWRLTHQKNYSRLPLRVASTLAERHHQHMICAHQHRSAAGRSHGNHYSIIDMGGCHEPELMSYVQLTDSTSPIMTKGFVLLKNGIGTLFTPPEYKLMDWSMWL